MKTKTKVLLLILDGWGHGTVRKADAIALAQTPAINKLYTRYPNAELVTFGEDVGLPEGQMGNSEVGHMNIGAGRVVYQDLARIHKSIKDRELHTHPTILEACAQAKKNGTRMHLIGLVSDGGVHSHINHLMALCDILQEQAVTRVFIHAFTDGRDCDPKSGAGFIKQVQDHISDTPIRIASVVGRYYAMDRDKRWERVKRAYDLMVHAVGNPCTDVVASIEKSYASGVTDEFLEPLVNTQVDGRIRPGDVVIFFNFRTDRPREITEMLCRTDFPLHQTKALDLHFVTMTRYDETFNNVHVVFQKDDLSDTLGEVLSRHNKTQVRIAETEKYPHVTFFFNGGREELFPGERRLLVPSPKVATYDLKPEMSAVEITDAIVADIALHEPDFICLNYANADMVGHTGVMSAAIKAAETVSSCTNQLLKTAARHGYITLIIADHGNSDYLINPDGSPNTAHTTNMVPIILVGKLPQKTKVRNGRLADIAPTILHLLGLPQPASMTGQSLVG